MSWVGGVVCGWGWGGGGMVNERRKGSDVCVRKRE